MLGPAEHLAVGEKQGPWPYTLVFRHTQKVLTILAGELEWSGSTQGSTVGAGTGQPPHNLED